MIRVLSLGAGVQSSTVALMSAAGELPSLDGAIFADTQNEPAKVYDWLAWLETQVPFPIVRVTAGDLRAQTLRLRRSQKSGRVYIDNLIPAYLDNGPGKRPGMLGRRCTGDFKVEPIVRELARLVGRAAIRRLGACTGCGHRRQDHYTERVGMAGRPFPFGPRAVVREHCRGTLDGALIDTTCRCSSYRPAPLVEQWIGISLDEADRMKPAQKKWIYNRWPLVDRNLTRQDCLAWMRTHGFPEPPKSACTFCPFHSDAQWLQLRTTDPTTFAAVVQFERDLQDACRQQETLIGVPYLHDSLKSIDTVDFQATIDRPGYTQLNLFRNDCEGLCGT